MCFTHRDISVIKAQQLQLVRKVFTYIRDLSELQEKADMTLCRNLIEN